MPVSAREGEVGRRVHRGVVDEIERNGGAKHNLPAPRCVSASTTVESLRLQMQVPSAGRCARCRGAARARAPPRPRRPRRRSGRQGKRRARAFSGAKPKYGVRDAACPLSTRGGTRLVRLVRGRGGRVGARLFRGEAEVLAFSHLVGPVARNVPAPGAALALRTNRTRRVLHPVLIGHDASRGTGGGA